MRRNQKQNPNKKAIHPWIRKEATRTGLKKQSWWEKNGNDIDCYGWESPNTSFIEQYLLQIIVQASKQKQKEEQQKIKRIDDIIHRFTKIQSEILQLTNQCQKWKNEELETWEKWTGSQAGFDTWYVPEDAATRQTSSL